MQNLYSWPSLKYCGHGVSNPGRPGLAEYALFPRGGARNSFGRALATFTRRPEPVDSNDKKTHLRQVKMPEAAFPGFKITEDYPWRLRLSLSQPPFVLPPYFPTIK